MDRIVLIAASTSVFGGILALAALPVGMGIDASPFLWFILGGIVTLASYDVKPKKER